MNAIKKLQVRIIDATMLNCEKATFLITKSEFEKLSCVDSVRLKIHLMGCKFCNNFKKQSEIISYALKKVDEIKPEGELSLSEDQKERIKKSIAENLNK